MIPKARQPRRPLPRNHIQALCPCSVWPPANPWQDAQCRDGSPRRHPQRYGHSESARQGSCPCSSDRTPKVRPPSSLPDISLFLFSSAFLFSTCKYTTFFRTHQLPPPFLSSLIRRTVAFIAIACRENQFCKIRRKIIQTI